MSLFRTLSRLRRVQRIQKLEHWLARLPAERAALKRVAIAKRDEMEKLVAEHKADTAV